MRSILQRARTFVGVLALGGLGACWWTGRPPQVLAPPDLDRPAEPTFPAMVSVPDDARPLTAAEQLEARLAALAADVERRRREAPAPGLIELDVEGLAASLTDMLDRVQDRASVSVHVRDLRTGHVLFDYFGDSPLIPASNQKLVTSAAALDLLGPDYVFTTRVLRDGPTLYLVGEGDPLLHVDDLAAMADLTTQAVDIAGIDRLVVDDSAFSQQRFGPGYSEEGPGYAYQAPSGALSLSFNTVELAVYPVAGSSRLGVSVSPPSDHVKVQVRARTGSRNRLTVTAEEQGGHTVVRVDGTLPRSHGPVTFRRRVVDPGLYTGTAFASMLADLTASEPLAVERGAAPSSAELVVANDSLPLSEVLDNGLAYSNNFIAEQILRTLAWRMTGDPGDWNAGQQILHDYWEALTGPQPMFVENASGLSRDARLTTHGLVDLIAMAHRSADRWDEGPDEGHSLIDVLPVAGERGTMRTRLRLSGKRVRAKTGTLDGVSGLSGVITSEAGEPQVGFSILINTQPDATFVADSRRALEDRIVMRVLAAVDDYEAQHAGLAAPRGEGAG